MKKIYLVLLFSTLLFANNVKSVWTIQTAVLSDKKTAERFVKNYIKKPKGNIYIVKTRKYYKVLYGAFGSYLEAKKFLKREKRNIRNKNPYVLGTRYNLSNLRAIPNLVKFQKYSNSSVLERTVLVAPKKKANKKQPIVKPQQKVVKKQKEELKATPVVVKKEKEQIVDEPMVVDGELKAVDENSNSKYKVNLSLKYIPYEFTGDLKFKTNDTSAKIDSDLGIDEKEGMVVPYIELARGNHSINLSGFSTSYAATNKTSNDLTLNSKQYTSGSNFKTNMDITWNSFGYKYDFSFVKVGADMNMYTNEFKLDTDTDTITAKGEFGFISLNLSDRISFLPYSFGYAVAASTGGDVSYIHYEAELGLRFIYGVDLSVGYEARSLDIDSEDFIGKNEFNGMFVRLSKEF